MKALEKDRRKRFQTARDMQMAIDDFLSEHEFSPSNVHLANFLKQQFEDELQKEQQNARDLEPAHRLHTKVKRHLHRQLSRACTSKLRLPRCVIAELTPTPSKFD